MIATTLSVRSYTGNRCRGAETRNNLYGQHNLAAIARYEIGTDDGFDGIVHAFDKHVGFDFVGSRSGVSSSKIITRSTVSSDENTAARASSVWVGRLSPFSV